MEEERDRQNIEQKLFDNEEFKSLDWKNKVTEQLQKMRELGFKEEVAKKAFDMPFFDWSQVDTSKGKYLSPIKLLEKGKKKRKRFRNLNNPHPERIKRIDYLNKDLI